MKSLRVPVDSRLESATVRRWRVAPGQVFAAGDVLVEFELESSHVHIAAPTPGVIKSTDVTCGETIVPGMVLGSYSEEIPMTAEHDPAPTRSAGKPATPPATAKAPADKEATLNQSQKSDPTPAPATPTSGDPAKATPILLPEVGNSMEEGTIVEWKVQQGDTISVGDILYELETDKSVMEIEATQEGRLARIIAENGAMVPVKQPIALLADEDADAEAWLAAEQGETSTSTSAQATSTTASGKVSGAGAGAGPIGTVTPILLPEVGNSMEEGTIVEWKVKEGDTIAVGDILYELETDKSVMEIEATEAGRLARIVAEAGAMVPVKQVIAYLAEDDGDVDAFIAQQGSEATAPASPATPASPAAPGKPKVETAATPVPAISSSKTIVIPSRPAAAPATGTAPTTETGRIKASPAARRLADQRGVNLASLGPGSGPGGRILSTDVATAPITAASPAASPAAAAAAPTIQLAGPTGEAAAAGQMIEKPLTKMRRAIAANLVASKQSIPHFYVKMTIDAGPLFSFYKQQKPATGCSINDIIVLAVGQVMAEYPGFRSQYHGDKIREFPEANVGIAVGVPDGLVVPVALAVDRQTLASLVPMTKQIVANAREGRVDNMGKGHFTISNMGMFGVEDFQAIINPPESGILAVSAVRETVIVRDGAMRPGKVMTMTLSADHRVVDGALGAEFLRRLKEVLENPECLP